MTSKYKTIIISILFIVLVPFSTFAKNIKHIGNEPCNKLLSFRLKSPGFSSGGTIPLKFVCNKIKEGQNLSIPLVWTGAPTITKSFAILMYDLHPVANNFVHWAVINIPPEAMWLTEGSSGTTSMPAGSIELSNSSGSKGYIGPCPPQGSGKHEYRIIVYALNTKTLNLPEAVTLEQFEAALKNIVLAKSEISGYFEQ